MRPPARSENLLALKQGTADIGYVAASRTVLIPLMKDNKLVAYKLE